MLEWLGLSGALLFAGTAVTFGFLSRKDNRELVMSNRLASDKDKLLTIQTRRADDALSELNATRGRLAKEHVLRSVAEAKLNTAKKRVFELIRAHAGDATDDEVRQLTADAFGVELSVVPPPVSEDPDALINPFDDV